MLNDPLAEYSSEQLSQLDAFIRGEIESGNDCDQVIANLLRAGWPSDAARIAVDNTIFAMAAEKEHREAARLQRLREVQERYAAIREDMAARQRRGSILKMVGGALICALGLVATALSFFYFRVGKIQALLWGMTVLGAVLFFAGLTDFRAKP